jgi:hypothetical protein
MSNQIIKNIIRETINGYNDLLQSYYPAHESTGFMEVNQVFQFCMAASKLYEDTLCWLEPPLPKKERRYPHIDAVIFLPSQETAIFVEAKRINNPSEKKRAIVEDVCRLLKKANRTHITSGARFTIKKHFIVALADVWLESKHKKSIPYWWTLDPQLQLQQDKYMQTTFIEEIEHATHSNWPKDNQSVHNLKKAKSTAVRDNYRLLFGYYEIDLNEKV